MTESRAFRDQNTIDPRFDHPSKSPESRAMWDIRTDVEAAFSIVESRTGYPKIAWVDGHAKVPKTGGDIVIRGSNLLQGQTFDALTLWATTSAVVITALQPGDTGFTIQVTDTETAGSESVTKTASAFVIGIEAGVSSANQIATAINADGADSDGYLRAASGGAGTTNAVAAATAMTGGAGEGLEILVSGVEALPANTSGTAGAAAVSETAITLTVPDLTGEATPRVNGDGVVVTVASDGQLSDGLLVELGPAAPPVLDWVDGGELTAAGADAVIKGRNIVQGQSFATLTLGTGTSELVITALKPGADGNDYTVTVTASGGGETVSMVGTDITIDCDDGTSTANAIATLINADGADTDGYVRCASGGAGTVHPPAASANLAGGAGEGFECLVSGVECLPANTTGTAGAAAITATAVTVTVPDLTALGDARAATDLVNVTIESDGVLSAPFTSTLA